MLIVDKQAGAAGSLITEPPIIKMQLILILPLVPSHFVLEISRAGQSRDHRHRASSPFFTSNPISIFFYSSPLLAHIFFSPRSTFQRRTRRELKRWRALMFCFLLSGVSQARIAFNGCVSTPQMRGVMFLGCCIITSSHPSLDNVYSL